MRDGSCPFTAPPFFLLAPSPPLRPQPALAWNGKTGSTKFSALPRLLRPPGPASSPAAQGAEAGLEGGGMSSRGGTSVRYSRFVHQFPRCAGEGSFGVGFGRGSPSRLVRKFRRCRTEEVEYHLKRRPLEITTATFACGVRG